jgi:hypothetical protein
MQQRNTPHFVLAVMAMATIGSAYGWSSSANLLQAGGAWTLAATMQLFMAMVLGIGVGVAVATVPQQKIGYPRTAALGLAIWGAILLLLAQSGLDGGLSRSLLALCLLGGIGVGIAYLALLSIFRELMASRTTVLSGAIGPFGFATGALIACAALFARPAYDGLVLAYRGFGVLSIVCAVLILILFPTRSWSFPRKEPESIGWPARQSASRRLWLILFLNVAPGMALVSVAVPWFIARGASPHEVISLMCTALVALPAGQVLWAVYAKRAGERRAFLGMFLLRAVVFALAATRPTLTGAWVVLAIALACHGGGFGLVPKIVANTTLGDHPAALGYILSAWGLGGVAGIAVFYVGVAHGHDAIGFAALALLMLLGIASSFRYREVQA